MAIRTVAQRTALAAAYASAAPYGALFTADPGTSGTATGEVTGGSPAYARKAAGWGTAANSAVSSGSMVFDVPSGTTVTYFGLTVAGTAGGADVRDSVALTSQAFASQGQYTVNAAYTQS